MKILYIEARKKKTNEDIENLKKIIVDLNKLPKKLLLLYSIQYKRLAEEIKKLLISKGAEVSGFQQVLGCSRLKTNLPILLIGSGKFHAINLGLQNNVPIYIYNSGKIVPIDEKEIEMLKARKTGAISKFLTANNLGVIISSKPGQENFSKALKLKEIIEKKYPEKRVFLFISNNINLNEFENFPIDFWINTACPGLFYDSQKIINTDDILAFFG